MRSVLVKLSLVGLAIVVPTATAGMLWWSQQTSGLAPESMRGELAEGIIEAWSSEASRRYHVPEDAWARSMRRALATTDIANLERAAGAPDFEGMSLSLMGDAPSGPANPKLGVAGSDLVYTPLTPCRIVDTRVAGGPIAANTMRSFVAHTATDFTAQGGDATNCGIPANASALTVKVTASHPQYNGYLTVFPSNEARPLASSLNYIANIDTSNESHFRLCRPSCPTQFSVYSLFRSDVVVDVNGYFIEPEATALDCTVARQTGNLDLLGGLQTRSVSCPTGYTATGGGCGGPLGIGISNSQALEVGGVPTGWSCDMVGSLLSVLSYQVSATCCRVPGR